MLSGFRLRAVACVLSCRALMPGLDSLMTKGLINEGSESSGCPQSLEGLFEEGSASENWLASQAKEGLSFRSLPEQLPG